MNRLRAWWLTYRFRRATDVALQRRLHDWHPADDWDPADARDAGWRVVP